MILTEDPRLRLLRAIEVALQTDASFEETAIALLDAALSFLGALDAAVSLPGKAALVLRSRQPATDPAHQQILLEALDQVVTSGRPVAGGGPQGSLWAVESSAVIAGTDWRLAFGVNRAPDTDPKLPFNEALESFGRAILSVYIREETTNRFLDGVRGLAASLTTGTDRGRIQQLLCDHAVTLLGAAASRFYELDATSEYLAISGQTGCESLPEPRRSIPIKEHDNPICRAFLERIPLHDTVTGFDLYPVTQGEQAHGILAVHGGPQTRALSRRAPLLAALGGAALNHSQVVETLEKHSERDPVTGLYNRESILKRLEIEIRRAERSGQPVSLANVRIEGLADARKRFGVQVADALLNRASTLLSRATRTVNVIGRDRNDRFLVLIFDASKTQSHRASESIQKNFAVQDPKLAELGAGLQLTFGIAAYPEDAFDAESLTSRAGEALDEAIRIGPGSVVLYGALSAADSGFDL